MDIFLNEIAEAERIIESKDLGVKPSQSLFLLAKYYRYVMKYKKSKIITELTDFIKSTGINYRPSDWEKSVERQVDRTRNNPPINIEYIGATQKELEDIAGLKSPPVERIAFTALCLAKYRNIETFLTQGIIIGFVLVTRCYFLCLVLIKLNMKKK